ncbi:Rapamycin-insensitive companion of mTOR, N-term-domain-containing protein [Suillus subaureus]|uniref:Rapamycin-insensitive companion of mTOR, N-term-domain-containing protein n=1 Tax=Suillus subaureus TaxID=48587 RepID=A0A9P7JHK3_9AGAM|nr:Rapamycin-insensitive companion of mTOR, N-term-domain-containing protein [Suillus subaureus]KAG1822809.1 Rapamycin-insensitive companion of mTOR, N-term-domain-containing protein [Suillus subaureus]
MPTSIDQENSGTTHPDHLPSPLEPTNQLHEIEGTNRDYDDQLDTLNALLERENRIKEGAERFLKLPLNETMRLQVESELEMATGEIESLTRKIELGASSSRFALKLPVHDAPETSRGRRRKNGIPVNRRKFAGQAPPVGVRFRADSDDRDRDDFRTTLAQANACIKSLNSLSRPIISPPPASTPSATSSISAAGNDRSRVEVMNRFVCILQRNLRVRYEINLPEVVQAIIPALSDRCSMRCRAAAYRLIRHSLVDSDSAEELHKQPLEWFIVKSLARDNKHAIEREQVIKLIRTIVDIVSEPRDRRGITGTKTIPLSEPIMRAFVAVAEHAEDLFRPICVQTLAEMVLIDIDLVARSGGIRFLLHALGEGPVEVGPILAATFLHIIDSPRTRAYLHLGTDLEIALSAITDAYGKGADHADRMRSCTKIIQLMLRTWSGLMYFCLGDQHAIKSIVNTLRIPSLETREIVLDMFFDLFNIKAPQWYKTFIDGRRLTMYRKPRAFADQLADQKLVDKAPETLKLTDQYIALLVLVFTDAGLIDALTAMLEECTTGSNLSRKATLLMAEVMQMANRVLPLGVAARIQAVPRVFCLAADYNRGEHRIVGTSALSAIDSFNRNRLRLQPSVRNARPRANSVEDAVRRGQRQVEQVKIKMGMQMDDKTFQSSLLETQVMLTKDSAKWNFEMLQELIEGPLLNPKRLEEAIKVARFMRRLLSFFHPFTHRFSDLPRKQPNVRWVRLGCSLLTTLLASPDGIRFLASEDDLLKQIVKCFAQLDPFNGTSESDPIFSKYRLSETLTYGYFEMLGTLSKHAEGIELMEKFKFFTAFYHLSELRDREDLITAVITNLDYTIDGHPRIVLSKALTSSDVRTRLYATNHLGDLIRDSIIPVAWTLRLLLTQIYDQAPEVCELAIQFLEEACDVMEVLQLVVEMQPTMDHLGEIGHPLLLKFMSTPMGFRYLYSAGYIDREMDMWFHDRNIYYVIQVEIFLSKVFSSEAAEDDEDVLAFDGVVPPHFYGEMSKTELGCQVLSEKGHFSEFSHFIKQHGLESEDLELILKLKSILWAVGNVGATEGGLPFLEEEEIIPAILEIAEHSLIPSVRGSCFFVLGLISSTTQGAEILDDYRWEATLSPLGVPTGLCIPLDLNKFISLPAWDPVGIKGDGDSRLIPPTSHTDLEVISAIENLSNTVIANAASRSLARMKSRPEYRSAFSSPSVFFRALHTVSTQRYRLPVRRYIFDLFTTELDSELVLELSACANSLRAPPMFKQSEAHMNRVVSMFGLKHARGTSESDEDDDMDDAVDETVNDRNPVMITLRPVSRIIGFDK